jgi:transcriptional repressor NrdR
LVDRVERALQETGQREVTSEHIGRRALEELSEIDALAAVRFASVFRNFSSPRDYEDFFAEISATEKTDDGGEEAAVHSLPARR